jgi:RND family efflux transporter MFP subunit
MSIFGPGVSCIVCIVILGLGPQMARGEKGELPEWLSEPPPPVPQVQSFGDQLRAAKAGLIEATVINPFQRAEIGCEVGGEIEAVNFEEGNRISKGQVVVEISTEPYEIEIRKVKSKMKSQQQLVELAQQDLRTKEDLFQLDSATRSEVDRARGQLVSATLLLDEARAALEKAQRDLDKCQVRAPFSGYLAERFKQPRETVRALERLFLLVNSEKVLAIAHVPEEFLPRFQIGAEAVFVQGSGKKYHGKIDRVGKLIDPKTNTKKVYVLIENQEKQIEVGMTGSLQLAE